MKKLILILTTLMTINFASNLSIINPNWAIIDSINNFKLVKKHKYLLYLNIVKETYRVINIKPRIDESIYEKIFKCGIWNKMIKDLEKIYEKNHNKTIMKIISYMKKIKEKVKEKNTAIA